MSKKGRKMPEDVNLKDISAQIEKLSAAVQDLQKKVDCGDKGSDKDGDLSDFGCPVAAVRFHAMELRRLTPVSPRFAARRRARVGARSCTRARRQSLAPARKRPRRDACKSWTFKKILSEGPDEGESAEVRPSSWAGYRP